MPIRKKTSGHVPEPMLANQSVPRRVRMSASTM
jgi:hypothetical protein